MPITHQAPFGTMGTIHASDALKHERGVSRKAGPHQEALWFPRGLAIPGGEGGTGQRTRVSPPVHPRPKQTAGPDPQGVGLWVCGFLFCFS